jgi:RimJ/RimL family protein N-acetyltransferase
VALRKSISEPADPASTSVDWKTGLPELSDGTVTLRELRSGDAAPLVTHLNDPEVVRYITPCPDSADGFARFTRWARAERRRGALICYGVVPQGETHPVGVVQMWPVERNFSTAEWGFVIGRSFWGTGVFVRAATLMLDDMLERLEVYRLEARAVDINRRGNRALERLGAQREGTLRGGFQDGSRIRSHVMWSILAPEWYALRRLMRRHAS